MTPEIQTWFGTLNAYCTTKIAPCQEVLGPTSSLRGTEKLTKESKHPQKPANQDTPPPTKTLLPSLQNLTLSIRGCVPSKKNTSNTQPNPCTPFPTPPQHPHNTPFPQFPLLIHLCSSCLDQRARFWVVDHGKSPRLGLPRLGATPVDPGDWWGAGGARLLMVQKSHSQPPGMYKMP